MTRDTLVRALAGAALLVVVQGTSAMQLPAAHGEPPTTERLEVTDDYFGEQIVDPYRWLEDQNSPATRAWIDAQNAYTEGLLEPLSCRAALRTRLLELLRVDSYGMPAAKGGRYFFSRRLAAEDLSSLCVRQGVAGEDEVLVDPLALAADKSLSVSFEDVAEDGRWLAYSLRKGGEDEVEIRLLDVETRRELPDRLPRGRYFSLEIAPDRTGLYYALHGEAGTRVYYHRLGQPAETDELLFGQGYGPEKLISASLSDDGRWLLYTVYYGSAAKQTEVYLQDVQARGPLVTIVNDIESRFEGTIAGDVLYLQTDWEAPRQRILAVELANPDRARWREVVPQQEDVLDGFSCVGGRLCLSYLHDVKSLVRICEADGTPVREIEFPALGTVSGVWGAWDQSEAFFSFASYHIPPTIYRYDVQTGQEEVWTQLHVPLDSAQFEVSQHWFDSRDGQRVPMFVVHKRGLKLDGSNPALLTGYGGFNASLTPRYSSLAIAWMERGGVYAVANLRGGGEFGEAWHQAGMLGQKQNVFDDMIAAAEFLVAQGYTAHERLAISGGSNGGLLVGAVLTQRPDLVRAVVCSYPLLDMLRYHRFLVARFWAPEYGTSENPEQFAWLRAYSPYHRVREGEAYPAVLFITGDSDTRVDPLHARKMAALLQYASGGERPILLHYDTQAGHSAGRPVDQVVDDLVDELSFLIWQLQVE